VTNANCESDESYVTDGPIAPCECRPRAQLATEVRFPVRLPVDARCTARRHQGRAIRMARPHLIGRLVRRLRRGAATLPCCDALAVWCVRQESRPDAKSIALCRHRRCMCSALGEKASYTRPTYRGVSSNHVRKPSYGETCSSGYSFFDRARCACGIWASKLVVGPAS
jgi:hypothetical protein